MCSWAGPAPTEFDTYVRQLRDMKGSVPLDDATPTAWRYGRLCGAALARAHARAGQPALLAGYLGKSTAFDDSLAAFAVTYADQNDRNTSPSWSPSDPVEYQLSRDVDRKHALGRSRGHMAAGPPRSTPEGIKTDQLERKRDRADVRSPRTDREHLMNPASTPHRVVIVGGGFGGLPATRCRAPAGPGDRGGSTQPSLVPASAVPGGDRNGSAWTDLACDTPRGPQAQERSGRAGGGNGLRPRSAGCACECPGNRDPRNPLRQPHRGGWGQSVLFRAQRVRARTPPA